MTVLMRCSGCGANIEPSVECQHTEYFVRCKAADRFSCIAQNHHHAAQKFAKHFYTHLDNDKPYTVIVTKGTRNLPRNYNIGIEPTKYYTYETS